MPPKLLIASLLLACCSCKTTGEVTRAAAPAAPGSCRITGLIVSTIFTPGAEEGTPCARYPCRAKVKVTGVAGCGSAVTVPLNEGDTVEMNFAYTLHNTKKLFPDMKTHYPGLKKGQAFTAVAEQRMKMGTTGEFVVYGYEVE